MTCRKCGRSQYTVTYHSYDRHCDCREYKGFEHLKYQCSCGYYEDYLTEDAFGSSFWEWVAHLLGLLIFLFVLFMVLSAVFK